MRARDCSDGSRFTAVSPRSGFFLLLRLLLEDDDVLPWQDVARLDVPQGVAGHLLEYLALTHLVDEENGHLGVFEPILDEDEAPARLERLDHRLGHLVGMRELVIDVD